MLFSFVESVTDSLREKSTSYDPTADCPYRRNHDQTKLRDCKCLKLPKRECSKAFEVSVETQFRSPMGRKARNVVVYP